jgi:arylsulfatase A
MRSSLAVIALSVAGLAVSSAVEARAARPNVVYVLLDDMGYGEPTCYRPDSRLVTPNLDRLAARGMRFTDAHSASAVCTPTRYGILTGRYPWRIGQFGVLQTFDPPIIPESRLTVASFLKQHGYQTACIGKWHLGMTWAGGPRAGAAVPIGTRIVSGPLQVGFDDFYGFTHARNIGAIIEQDRVAEHVAPVENQPRMIARAVAWLQQRGPDKPFCLYFPMCPPHTPVVPAPEFTGKSGAVDTVGGDPRYGDWVYQGDQMLGRILDALEERGLAENTLVIATADNGASNRAYPPLRGAKTSIYEGGHRVPFIAAWPGKIKPGSVSDQTICHNDLLATCAEILGAKLPDDAGEDSVSILPALLGTARTPLREATVHQSMRGDLAIRQGPWKLIFMKDGARELYNLHDDLGETKNLLEAAPEAAARLTALMKSYRVDGRSTPGAPQNDESPGALADGSAMP